MEAERLPIVADVVVTVARGVVSVFTYTSYPVTATLSVEPVQVKSTLLLVFEGDARFVGAVGACVSPLVVTLIEPEYAEKLVTASFALTLNA